MIESWNKFTVLPETREALDEDRHFQPLGNTQHGTVIPGRRATGPGIAPAHCLESVSRLQSRERPDRVSALAEVR